MFIVYILKAIFVLNWESKEQHASSLFIQLDLFGIYPTSVEIVFRLSSA